MVNIPSRAAQWVEGRVREHSIGGLVSASAYLLLALAALGLWFGVVYGMMFMFAMVLVAIGIGVNVYVVFAVWGLQVVLYPMVRRNRSVAWDIERDVDGNVYLVKPENDPSGEHGFVNRGIFAGVFFACPIALEEAWREFTHLLKLRKIDSEPLTRMAGVLLDEQRKVTIEDLGNHMGGDALARALSDARLLPEFQFFANEPQGIAVTAEAIDKVHAT